MREIKFRGKRIDNGEWVYGDLVQNGIDYKTAIRLNTLYTTFYGEVWKVNPETVGQFTGLTDKNGKEIYEGDILEYEFEQIGKQRAIIYFNTKYASFLLRPLNNFQFTLINDGIVIGNIHDNPELLEVNDV